MLGFLYIFYSRGFCFSFAVLVDHADKHSFNGRMIRVDSSQTTYPFLVNVSLSSSSVFLILASVGSD